MQPISLRYRPIAVVLAMIVAVSALLSGCSDDQTQAPEEVAEAFITDLRRGERQRAMEAVWPETREQIEAAHEDLSGYLDDEPPIDRPRLLEVTRLESPMLVSRFDVDGDIPEEPADGEKLAVTIEYRDDRSAEVVLRWGAEAEQWFVDLPMEQRRPLQVGPDDDSGTDVPDEERKSDGESGAVKDEKIENE